MDTTSTLIHRKGVRIDDRASVHIRIELVAYLTLALIALVLRIAQLDTVPLSADEARRALAAWRVVSPEATGTSIIADSPILFTLHSLSFSTLGASEFTARFWTALAGVGLILTPVLFRDRLGETRAFLFSLILAFSPVGLLASRFDSPVVWSLLVTMTGLWSFKEYLLTGFTRYAVSTTISLFALVFLTDSAAPFFAVTLAGAFLFSLWLGRLQLPLDEHDEDAIPPSLSMRLAAWPWGQSLAVSGMLIFVLSTGFMLYPSGLSAIGELLAGSVNGLTDPLSDTPRFFSALVAIFYEPLTVVFGIAAVFWLRQSDRFLFIDRFLTGWAILAIVLALLYRGAGAEHALWLIVPLAGLASGIVAHMLEKTRKLIWWESPGWARWLIAVVMTSLLAMFAVHAQSLGRTLLNAPQDVFQLGSVNSVSAIWVIIIVLFVVIGYFLSASIWGAGITLRGGLLGVAAFMLVSSLGSGWNAAIPNASNPTELWHVQPNSSETHLLRQTLQELARRESGGFPVLTVYAAVPHDSVVAWILRDFPNTVFVPDADAARTQQIVIAPQMSETPDLGGDYVGQRFTVSRAWNTASLYPADLLAWWLQRKTRTASLPEEVVILWLRQDIYNGTPFDENAAG